MKHALSLVFAGSLLAQQTTVPPTTYRISTVAGVPWSATGPAQAPNAMFKAPFGVAYDRQGNLYVANYEFHSVRRIEPDGKVTTAAGDGAPSNVITVGDPGAQLRRLSFPRALAIDGDRFLYIAEPTVQRIRRLALATGTLAAIVGGNGVGFSADGTVGTSAKLNEVLGLAVDSQGDLIIAETGSHRIRRWTPATGLLSTIAGNGTAGFDGDNGPATSARLNRPSAVSVAANGDVYFFDFGNRRVRRVRGGTITTLAGTPTGTVTQGPGAQVNFGDCTGITLDADARNLYLTSESLHRIFRLQLSDNTVTVVAGTGAAGRVLAEGTPAANTQLFTPTNITVDPQGALVFADTNNHRIRRIGTDGTVRTVAGMIRYQYNGSVAPADAVFDNPASVRVAANGTLVVADSGNCMVRSIVTNSVAILAGAQGNCGLDNTLNSAVMDADRNVFWLTSRGMFYRTSTGPLTGVLRGGFAGSGLNLTSDGAAIQYLSPNDGFFLSADKTMVMGTTTYSPTLVFGMAGTGFVDGGQFQVKFNRPTEFARDSKGDRYVLDSGNNAIRRIRGFETSTLVRPNFFAGSLAVDSLDRVWLATLGAIFRLNDKGEYVDALGGGGATGYSPDGAAGRSIAFGLPRSLVGGRNGVLYFADQSNNVIRQLTPVVVQSLEIVDGNNQTGAAGAQLAAPLRVRVMGADGRPLSGQTIVFSSSVTGITLPDFVFTDASGIASVPVTLPDSVPATLTLTATHLPGHIEATPLPPVRFTITTAAPATLTDVAVAPQYGGGAALAGGSWIEVRGTGLATATAENAEGGETLGGLRVQVNGQPATLLAVSPVRIAAVLPSTLPAGPVEIAVLRDGAETPAAVLKAEVAALAPALLAPANLRGEGGQYVHARLDAETLAGPAELGAGLRPAKVGEKLTLTATGFGVNAPTAVEVRFGETAAAVDSVTPGPLGTYAIVVAVPEGVSGATRLGLTVDGAVVAQELLVAIE